MHVRLWAMWHLRAEQLTIRQYESHLQMTLAIEHDPKNTAQTN
jgi:hypothetical protein